VAGHDEIGQLVLTRTNLSPVVCAAVGQHHDLPEAPDALVCLLHVSDVITKALGFSFPLEAEKDCHPHALKALGVVQQDIDSLRDSVGPAVTAQVKELLKDVS
jgi:hypothetical protein